MNNKHSEEAVERMKVIKMVAPYVQKILWVSGILGVLSLTCTLFDFFPAYTEILNTVSILACPTLFGSALFFMLLGVLDDGTYD